MSYESWRISYQSSEQAARAAYAKVEELAARLVMAESAPKAVRLTQEEIKTVLKVNTLSSLVMRICRSIETAVLERNGLKPQAKGQGDHAASRGPWV